MKNLLSFNPFDFNFEDANIFRSNFKDHGKYYLLGLDMPGVSTKDLSINLDNDHIVVTGKRSDKNHENFTYTESFFMPSGIDHLKIEAAMENGVLTIVLPKKEELTKSIEIKEKLSF